MHQADFDKLAVVGGPAWVDWCIKLGGFLMKGRDQGLPSRAIGSSLEVDPDFNLRDNGQPKAENLTITKGVTADEREQGHFGNVAKGTGRRKAAR
jgi:hypothetical protein